MGIGAALAAIGTAIAGFVAANATYIIVGAVVGAVIGGISAAVQGGNILEGVLFGAVGGAVGGAVAGVFSEGAIAAAGGASGGAGGASGGAAVTTTAGTAMEVATSSDIAGLAAAEAGVTGGNAGGGLVAAGAEVGAGGSTGISFSTIGSTAAKQMVGPLVTGGFNLLSGGFAGGAAEEQATLDRELERYKVDKQLEALDKEIAAGKYSSSSSSGGEVAPNYSREVAEINAKSALDIANKKSEDLKTNIAAQEEERKQGYLREDEIRDRQRDTASGVLIKRHRTPIPKDSETTEIVPAVITPDTPEYK